MSVGRLDVAPLALPVDVCHFPRSSGEHEDAWPVDLAGEHDRVNLAEFLASLNDGELRVGGEHRDELHEMTMAESTFSLGSDREHSTVMVSLPVMVTVPVTPEAER